MQNIIYWQFLTSKREFCRNKNIYSVSDLFFKSDNRGCTCSLIYFNQIFIIQGGMKAVVWTDVFQSGIMIAGLLAIVIQVKCYCQD